MTCWLPVVVSGVTELPDAADEVTAGVDPAAAPVSTTKISKLGAADGAGVHWNAQPMFHVPPAMVNEGLVQSPVCCTSGTSTVAGPTTAGVVVPVEPAAPATVVAVEPAAVVAEVEPPAAVVEVDPPAAVVVVDPAPAPALADAEPTPVVAVEPLGGGSLYPPLDELAVDVLLGPASAASPMPSTAATSASVTSCQVLQERRSLMSSSPFSGW
jgi:hypothetical protein